MTKKLTAVLVGLGHRTRLYGSYALYHPDELEIVGLADPNAERLARAASVFDIPPERCFESAEALAARPAFADAAINGTMDRLHVPTTLPLLQAGYHVLLEKPIAPSRSELLKLLATARETKRTLMICHVLRYAPFYVAIRRHVLDGTIGEVISIQTSERVSYHHMATAFVRGKWRRRDESNPMLLAKCCHDLDLLCWFKSGTRPLRVASYGDLTYFRPEKAPPGAGTRCLVDCQIEPECPYSAKKIYVERGLWSFYAWESLEEREPLTVADKLESLRTDNPYGRCVWHCDNDVVDHQTVIAEFADGTTATHIMSCGTARAARTIHLVGTAGEIEGVMEEGTFVIRHPSIAGHDRPTYREEQVKVNVTADMHGGGDMRLVQDFVAVLRGESPSISTTSIEDSIYGHLIAYAADESMRQHRMVEIAAIGA